MNEQLQNPSIKENQREEEIQSVWLEKKSFRIALISTFSALAIVLGYSLAHLPNIELITLTIFLSGFILGKRDGMIVGFLSSLIFTLFNPIGTSPLPLLAFQLFYYALTGLLGALTKIFLTKRKFYTLNKDLYKIPVMMIFGIIGAFMTIFFQIFSSIMDALIYLGSLEEFWLYFLRGIPFTAIHIIGNTLGFIFILPGLIQLITKMID
ncbi:MAG: hypothetical protein ACW986_03235 [Promethearchaeota archaeon]|jgi:uncharacterized membrane protein